LDYTKTHLEDFSVHLTNKLFDATHFNGEAHASGIFYTIFVAPKDYMIYPPDLIL
jgi:hypothetical protein